MTSITIIGAGNMASAIGTLALAGGNTVEITARDEAKEAALARSLGAGVTTGTWGATPTGDIVILAVLFQGAVQIVREYGEALGGKIVVDITNSFDPDGSGLAVAHDTSVAQLIADVAPADTHVIKAFNTLFRDVLAAGGRDVFMAGDDAEAKAVLAAFITSLGHHPRDTGDLSMAHWLEGAGLLEMGLARNGLGFGLSLGVDLEAKK